MALTSTNIEIKRDAKTEQGVIALEQGKKKITPEGEMMRRYQAGDPTGLDDLVIRYQEDGYWAARQLIKEETAALDVVQEAFMRVLNHMNDYDATRPFRSWFMQIVRNLSIDWLRRQRRQVPCSEIVQEVSENNAARIEASEREQRVKEVLDALPAKYRDILVMREMERVRADEIAKRIDVGYKTTRWRIHQARKLFKAEWERRFGEYIN